MAMGSRLFEGFNHDVRGGMHVPRVTPEAVQQRLTQVFYEIGRDPGFRDWARSTGTDLALPMRLSELDPFYQQEVARYQAMARSMPTGS